MSLCCNVDGVSLNASLTLSSFIIIIIIIIIIIQSLPTRVYHFLIVMDNTDPMCRVYGSFQGTVDHTIKTSGHMLTPAPSTSLPDHFLACFIAH